MNFSMISKKIDEHIKDLISVQAILESFSRIKSTAKEVGVAIVELEEIKKSIINENENRLSDLRAKQSIISEMSSRLCVNCKHVDEMGVCRNKKSFCFDIDVSSNHLFGCSEFQRSQEALDLLIENCGSVRANLYTFTQNIKEEHEDEAKKQ